MLRHIFSALFFVLLSFLMVRPSASNSLQMDLGPLLPIDEKETYLFEQVNWPGAQCHKNIGPMVLSLENLESERLYCALENKLNQRRWSWNSEMETQHSMSSL